MRGEGPYAVVSQCFRIWLVLLYAKVEDRDAIFNRWEEIGCGGTCIHEHVRKNLTLPEPAPVRKVWKVDENCEYPR